jgi:hypothetical protein
VPQETANEEDRALDLMQDIDRPGAPEPSARSDFCVVVPALDEAENIPDLVAELRATFERHGLGGEVIVVDDGPR